MSKVVFYSVLQSLDAMTEIAALDYRDPHVVSIELVKFMSLNTAIDSVNKLEEQSTEYTTNLKQLNKDNNTTKTAINSVGNKADELKNVIENIKKRIDKLEKLTQNISNVKSELVGIYNFPISSSSTTEQHQEVVRPLRLEEQGEISEFHPQSFCLIFETAPVWLTALRKTQVKYIFIL